MPADSTRSTNSNTQNSDPQDAQAKFDASTIAKYKKVQKLATDPACTPAERDTAAKLLVKMETKYPGLTDAIKVRDEYDRRVKESNDWAKNPNSRGWAPGFGPHGPGQQHSQGPQGSQSSQNPYPGPHPYPPRGGPVPEDPFEAFRPGTGFDPFQNIPRATDAVQSANFGDGLFGQAKRAVAQKVAEYFDQKVERMADDWEKLSLEEIEREILGRRHPFRPEEGDPILASQRRIRKERYKMASLDSLLNDHTVTEAGVIFELDENDDDCVRFDVSMPLDVWERASKNPREFIGFLRTLVEEAEAEMNEDGEEEDDDPTPPPTKRSKRKK